MGKIGPSTSPETATKKSTVGGTHVPASFRYNNPGAQYPSHEAAKFGQLGYGIIGGAHKIAHFPSVVNGAACNFELMHRVYTGMTIGAAGKKWTGAHGFGIPGYDSSATLTKTMVNNPETAIPLMKAVAHRESGKGNNLSETQWVQAHQMFKLGSADAFLKKNPEADVEESVVAAGTGEGLVERALKHVGEKYEHVLVPKNDANWDGPWDCAEFTSWLVYQEAEILYGCDSRQPDPAKTEAYTGYWQSDLKNVGKQISVEEAAATPGGILLRNPPSGGGMGHIVLCDGLGGTIEAKGKAYGVVQDKVAGRRWDSGILVPGIRYQSGTPIAVTPPANIYRVGAPNMNGTVVMRIQQALTAQGYDTGGIDGAFGTGTEAAVVAFQRHAGIVVDGEVGPQTAAALGISLAVSEVAVAETTTKSDAAVTGIASPQLLELILKGGTMANNSENASSGQALLVLVLQAALSGKPLDPKQLLLHLLAGQLPTNPAKPAPEQPKPVGDPDLNALLVPLLIQMLTGTPVAETLKPKIEPAPQPAEVKIETKSVVEKPSVQLGIAGVVVSGILQALGIVGTPFGIGTESTDIGTLATVIPAAAAAIGATGGLSTLLNLGISLLTGLRNKSGG